MAVLTPNPANTMQLQSILNRIQKQRGFVYRHARFVERGDKLQIIVAIRERRRCRPVCSGCYCKRPAYDRLRKRRFQFVPLWGIRVYFVYAPRRCDCPRSGVRVELLPWAEGKQRMTTALVWFLANWAKVLTWQETAARFRDSWHTVFTAVDISVTWGRMHQKLTGIRSIGVDELSWKVGQKHLTLVYQIDNDCRRLLWIGRDRTAETLNGFFEWLGEERCQKFAFVVSDMWKAFVSTVAKRANTAIHVLDRFHIMRLFNEAIDQVRRGEARILRSAGDTVTLKHTR